jgi:hypothetical protein
LGSHEDVLARKEEVAAKLCKLGEAITAMKPDDRAAIEYAIASSRKDFSAAWIHRTVVNNGFPMGVTVVKEHVARKCACVH